MITTNNQVRCRVAWPDGQATEVLVAAAAVDRFRAQLEPHAAVVTVQPPAKMCCLMFGRNPGEGFRLFTAEGVVHVRLIRQGTHLRIRVQAPRSIGILRDELPLER